MWNLSFFILRLPIILMSKKKQKILTIGGLAVSAVLIVGILYLFTPRVDTTLGGKYPGQPYLGGFCGTSTFGPCESNEDCMVGGCSGEVCQSVNEEPVGTPCWWKDCFEDEKYGVSCQCIEGRCQWAKGELEEELP